MFLEISPGRENGMFASWMTITNPAIRDFIRDMPGTEMTVSETIAVYWSIETQHKAGGSKTRLQYRNNRRKATMQTEPMLAEVFRSCSRLRMAKTHMRSMQTRDLEVWSSFRRKPESPVGGLRSRSKIDCDH